VEGRVNVLDHSVVEATGANAPELP